MLTVVELDVIPVDHRAHSTVYGKVASSRPALSEPGSERGVRNNVLASGKVGAELSRERDQPIDASARANGTEILVVNLGIQKLKHDIGLIVMTDRLHQHRRVRTVSQMQQGRWPLPRGLCRWVRRCYRKH